jgi:hypothetical protein
VVDILAEGFFPATKSKLYQNRFKPLHSSLQRFGLAGGASTLVAGRNIGKATGFYGALVYKF